MRTLQLSMILTVGLMFSIVSIFCSLSNAKIDPKTIAGLWLFDEGTGDTVKDSSGNGHNGKLIGNPKFDQGKFGKALSFDGVDDYVTMPFEGSLEIAKEITLQAWINHNCPTWAQIISREGMWNVGCIGYVMDLTPDPKLRFQLKGVTSEWTVGNSIIQKNQWVHVTCTWDGATKKLYVNGKLDGSANATGEICDGERKELHFGKGWDPFYKGSMDNVAIFNVALTEEQIKETMEGLKATAVAPQEKLATTWARLKTLY
ncbi:LamG domain-containing protein [Candidatus Poribacteria bacterium]|nr:LamG domain-containing protein [Candidatus Poribacteria bacterium]